MAISELELGALAHLIFNKPDIVPADFFQIEQLRAIYELYLEHINKYSKIPTREQFILQIKQSMNGSSGIALTMLEKVYGLEEEVRLNYDFYQDTLINWKKCSVTSSRIEELVRSLEKKEGSKIEKILAELNAQLSEFSTSSQNTIHDIADTVELFDPRANEFILTGYGALDTFGGIPLTSHVMVVGGTNSGKTLFGLNLLTNMYEKNDGTILYFSLEMPKSEMVSRLVSAISGVPFMRLYTGMASPEEKLQAYTAFAKFKYSKDSAHIIDNLVEKNKQACLTAVDTKPAAFFKAISNHVSEREERFIIIDDESIDLARLGLIIDAYSKKHNLIAVCIDNLQILKRHDTKEAKDAYGEISQEIRRKALKHNIVTVLLAQRNLAETMVMGSYSSQHPATLIWTIENPDEGKMNNTMFLECQKTRAIPVTHLSLQVDPETMRVFD